VPSNFTPPFITLGFRSSLYDITFPPKNASKIGDVKIIQIEILEKIAKISFSHIFYTFADIRYQSDDCCFCIGQDVCVDCQVRRKEKLK
jgi:hypothetical protein